VGKERAFVESGNGILSRMSFRFFYAYSGAGLVFLIENKTLSPEGDRQLARYWEEAEREAPSFAIGGLFLTPDGRPPKTAGKYSYCALSYGEIAKLLDKCVEFREVHDPGVILVGQYASAIRRWFVEDPEKKRLVWRIYKKYPAAAAYLSTGGVNPMWQISEHLQGLVRKQGSNLKTVYDRSGNKPFDFWFVPCGWDRMVGLRHSSTSKREKQADDRLLVFWFDCDPVNEHEYETQLNLYLGIVPGAGSDTIAKLIISVAKDGPPVSRGVAELHDEPQPNWTHLS
jgi:hypothetical protein